MAKPLKNDAAKSVVFGLHAVEALLQHHAERITKLIVNQQRQDEKIRQLLQFAQQKNIAIERLTKTVFEQQTEKYAPSATTQGILAFCVEMPLNPINSLEELFAQMGERKPLLLILDGVQDPHNLGACLRSVNAAGAQAVIIPQDRAAPLNATASKVASGAAGVTPVITVTNLARALQWLKDQGVWIYGMAGEATKTLYDTDFCYPTAFVLGAEGEGLRRLTREYCDELLAIPMTGSVSSLNVSVAAGVCLFEAVRQRQISLR